MFAAIWGSARLADTWKRFSTPSGTEPAAQLAAELASELASQLAELLAAQPALGPLTAPRLGEETWPGDVGYTTAR